MILVVPMENVKKTSERILRLAPHFQLPTSPEFGMMFQLPWTLSIMMSTLTVHSQWEDEAG